MQRSILLLFTLCGLLWPSAGHSQDPVDNAGDRSQFEISVCLRYPHPSASRAYQSEEDTLFVDWVTVYAKPEDATSTLAAGTPATRYWINLCRRLAGQDVEFENVEFFSLASHPLASTPDGGRFYDAHVRRDTLLLELVDGYEYLAGFPVVFPDESEYRGDLLRPPSTCRICRLLLPCRSIVLSYAKMRAQPRLRSRLSFKGKVPHSETFM